MYNLISDYTDGFLSSRRKVRLCSSSIRCFRIFISGYSCLVLSSFIGLTLFTYFSPACQELQKHSDLVAVYGVVQCYARYRKRKDVSSFIVQLIMGFDELELLEMGQANTL